MRQRITISLAPDLLERAERIGRRRGATTRSAVIEQALVLLLRDARARELERSLDAYYAGTSAEEKEEEAALVRAFNRSQRRSDLDREGLPSKTARRNRR